LGAREFCFLQFGNQPDCAYAAQMGFTFLDFVAECTLVLGFPGHRIDRVRYPGTDVSILDSNSLAQNLFNSLDGSLREPSLAVKSGAISTVFRL
jgi:hypothetical protein